MNAFSKPVNTTAPLKNVAAMMALIERLKNKRADLPGVGCFYGWSGLGKSMATTYAANAHRAVYVEAKSSWTKKSMMKAILCELGVRTLPSTVADMVELAAQRLVEGRKVLLIDEADYVVDRGYIDTVRDIYQSCLTPIVLIGEERLPDKLAKFERMHNRVLAWVPAQPCDLDDAGHLRKLYCDKTEVADDLLQRLLEVTDGGARRVCVNLDNIQEEALTHGWDRVDLATWGDRPFHTGNAPARRPK